jgi:hypothetical protein
VSKAATLIRFWEEDMKKGVNKSDPLSYQSDYLTQCSLVVDDVTAWEKLRADLSLDDSHAIELDDGPTTLGEASERVLKLREMAQKNLGGAAQEKEDALAPFRAVLKADKLAIFEDHPANEFRYYTTNKKIIETPEELAKAKFWYFDGVTEFTGKGKVDGVDVEVTERGYRVLGYKFDAKHKIVDEYEETGRGDNAPKTAFKHS